MGNEGGLLFHEDLGNTDAPRGQAEFGNSPSKDHSACNVCLFRMLIYI